MTNPSNSHNRKFLLAARPVGALTAQRFTYRQDAVPEPADAEFLARNLLVSIDPAMRGWMVNRADYVAPLNIGAARFAEAARALSRWVSQGRITHAEHLIEGFDNLPEALAGIFRGENIGKQIVRISE